LIRADEGSFFARDAAPSPPDRDKSLLTKKRKGGAVAAFLLVSRFCHSYCAAAKLKQNVKSAATLLLPGFVGVAKLKFLSVLRQVHHGNFKFKSRTRANKLLELL